MSTDFDWRSLSGHWYLRWREAIRLAKECEDVAHQDAYQLAAVIAQMGYVINEALENVKERGNT